MGSSERLFHAVLQAGELAHRVVTAKQEKEERNKLTRVHSPGNDFTLPKEQQQHDEENADHLDRRR